MIIFYGSSHFCKKRKVKEWMPCPHCHRGSVMTSYTAFEWGHLYWIPLIPFGSVRAVLSCPACKKLYKFASDGKKREQAIANGRQHTREQMAAGQDVVPDVAIMAHMGDFEGAEEFIVELRSAGNEMMASAANGRFLQLQGLSQPAEEEFLRALESDGTHPAAHYWFGRFLLDEGRDEEAISHLRHVPHDGEYAWGPLLNILADRRRRQGDWPGAALMLDEMLRLDPNLAQDKHFAKAMEKAHHKTARADDAPNPYAMR